MTNKINNLCNTISYTVCRIDSELKEIDKKGIFFAPELHIAFECGKAITVNGPNIWGEKQYNWKRETKFEKYGLADLCFEGDTVNSGDADPHSGDVDPPPGGFLFWTAKIGKLSNKLKNYFLFLNDSPFSSILNEPFINLSRIASATVPSPIISYHLFTGN